MLRAQLELHRALADPVSTAAETATGVTPPATHPAPWPAVPGYEVLVELGRGGMGVVYQARHQRLNRVVALKMVLHAEHADRQGLERFLAEAEAIAGLHHPNVVQLFDSGQHHGLPYFTLEFVPGGSLADRLRKQPLKPTEAARLVQQVARGVQHAHERGIIHRDLKPANVLLASDGTPKVTDFGLARRVETGGRLTSPGAVLGTPSYMAPEQAAGDPRQVGPLADVYALGAVLYECLTGRPPFRAPTPMDTLLQLLGEEPAAVRTLQPHVPRDLETICHRCMHKEPGRRYGSAAALADDLGRFLAGEPVQARPVGAAERVAKWVRRHPAVAGLLGVVAAVTLLGGALATWNWREALRQRADAVWHRGLAEVAARDAEESAEQERVAKEEATKGKALAEQNLYFNQIALAQREYDAGHVRVMMDLLDACPEERRGWEWRYLRRLGRGTPLTLLGHTSFVSGVAFSPDGTRIATASEDQTVKVWDARTGREVITLKGHADWVRTLAFSPDGARIATASGSGGLHRPGVVKVWDARTGQESLTLLGHTAFVNDVCFSPDGARIVSASLDGKVKVWDTRTGKEERSLTGLRGGLNTTAFSPDGIRIAGAGGDSAVKVWDARTGREVFTLRGHAGAVFCVTFSPDGSRLASASYDRTVKVWDARTGREVITLEGYRGGGVKALAFSPDGTRIAGAGTGGTVKLWDSRTGREVLALRGHTDYVSALAYSPDGTRLASAGGDKMVRVWDVRTGREVLTLEGDGDVRALAFSPDNAQIAGPVDRPGRDGAVKVWDARTGREALTLRGHTGQLTGVAFNPDGTRIASAGGGDGTVRVWDARTVPVPRILKGHTGEVAALGFGPDGTRLSARSGENVWRTWDTRTGNELPPIPLPDRGTPRLAVSPDRRFRAVARGSEVLLIDTQLTAEQREELRVLWLDDPHWFEERLTEAERAAEWFAATFHAEQLIRLRPEDRNLIARRDRARTNREARRPPGDDPGRLEPVRDNNPPAEGRNRP